MTYEPALLPCASHRENHTKHFNVIYRSFSVIRGALELGSSRLVPAETKIFKSSGSGRN